MPLAATLVEKKNVQKHWQKLVYFWGESILNYTFLQILVQCVLRGMKIM